MATVPSNINIFETKSQNTIFTEVFEGKILIKFFTNVFRMINGQLKIRILILDK